MGLFIDVSELPPGSDGFFQITFLFLCYGYILMYASNLISDGSELLLLVPSISGLVGSVILPILGAIPDGCIVLFSGMGPNAQDQLNVGVGALAGSTIMLLTVPWLLSVYGGRVNIVNGQASYSVPKLPSPHYVSLSYTGVAISKTINRGAIFMLFSALPYLVIQIPGLWYLNAPIAQQSMADSVPAKLALLLCCLFLVFYLYEQYAALGVDSKSVVEVSSAESIRQSIVNGDITLLGVMYEELSESIRSNNNTPAALRSSHARAYQAISSDSKQYTLSSQVPMKSLAKLRIILKPFFNKYDRNVNGTLDQGELAAVFSDLGENISAKALKELFTQMDSDSSGDLDFDEFLDGVVRYCLNHRQIFAERRIAIDAGFDNDSINSDVAFASKSNNGEIVNNSNSNSSNNSNNNNKITSAEDDAGVDGDDDNDEEEIPEDLAHLLPDEQQRRIKLRSAWLMGIGTALVLLFSDPMVDVMTEIGQRTEISPFYIGFLLAPLASNASEVIASYNYAQKKTSSSMTIALSSLQGAAVMNNSFVLGIFMFLIVFKGLAWQFFAETTSILLVELVMAIMAMKSTHTLFDAICVISLYPISLCLVAYLESIGWN